MVFELFDDASVSATGLCRVRLGISGQSFKSEELNFVEEIEGFFLGKKALRLAAVRAAHSAGESPGQAGSWLALQLHPVQLPKLRQGRADRAGLGFGQGVRKVLAPIGA